MCFLSLSLSLSLSFSLTLLICILVVRRKHFEGYDDYDNAETTMKVSFPAKKWNYGNGTFMECHATSIAYPGWSGYHSGYEL